MPLMLLLLCETVLFCFYFSKFQADSDFTQANRKTTSKLIVLDIIITHCLSLT